MATATKSLKVADYRDLIDEVFHNRRTLLSSVTIEEWRAGAEHLRRAVQELEQAECRTAQTRDLIRAVEAIRQSKDCLGLEKAMHWLHHRTLDRMARGVEGTYQKMS